MDTKKKKPPKSEPNSWMRYAGIGIQMVVTILGCTFLGKYADDYFNHEILYLTIAGAFTGFFASIWFLIKYTR